MREIWANWANDHRQYSFLHTSLDLSINTLCLLLLIVHPNLKGRRAYIHDWWNSKQNICISKIYKKSHINMYAGILVLRGYTYTHAQTHTQKQPISIFVSIFFLPNPPSSPWLSIHLRCVSESRWFSTSPPPPPQSGCNLWWGRRSRRPPPISCERVVIT